MSTETERLRRNAARVEFIACMDEIERFLAQGFDKKMVHARLVEEGRISMAYVTFCKLIAKSASNALHVASLYPASSQALTRPGNLSTPQSGLSRSNVPKVAKVDGETFKDPKSVDLNSVF